MIRDIERSTPRTLPIDVDLPAVEPPRTLPDSRAILPADAGPSNTNDSTMTEEKYGIPESQDIERLALNLVDRLSTALEDNTLSGGEILGIVAGIAGDIMPAISGADQVGNEMRNLSRAEIKQLADAVRAKATDGYGDLLEAALWAETGFFKLTGRYIYNDTPGEAQTPA